MQKGLTIRIPEELKKDFDNICKSKSINVSALLRNFIEEFVNENTKEEMEKMENTSWEFEGYTVYDEQEVLKFENNEGDILGYVAMHDHRSDMIKALNNSANPIQDGWEDGLGNTINLEGWGE